MGAADIEKHKNIFLIGIGGCGVSAIGKILHEMGFKVSGSDAKESSNTIRLRDLGVKVHIEHNPSRLRFADIVVYSSAVSSDNVELAEARARDLTVLKRAEMLSWIMDKFEERIAVAGTHGKTTTTSMIAKILVDAGLDPTYMIGGETDYVDGNARLGKSKYAVAEADESDGSFLELNPTTTILTNIEPDHMEYFGSVDNLHDSFRKFVGKTSSQGLLIAGMDSPPAKEIALSSGLRTITYGLDPEADMRPAGMKYHRNGSVFNAIYRGKALGEVRLSVPGEQNVVNSLAAIIVGLEAGVPFAAMAKILQSFSGAKRRFTVVGEAGGIMIVDDYAHHPTEVKATLRAAKAGWGDDRRIIAVFQPHRYTRTLSLYQEFGESFLDADLVVLTDIYAASETPIQNVDGRLISNEVEKRQDVVYVPRKEKIPDVLMKTLKPNDLVLIMGAGDINSIAKELISRIKIKSE